MYTEVDFSFTKELQQSMLIYPENWDSYFFLWKDDGANASDLFLVIGTWTLFSIDLATRSINLFAFEWLKKVIAYEAYDILDYQAILAMVDIRLLSKIAESKNLVIRKYDQIEAYMDFIGQWQKLYTQQSLGPSNSAHELTRHHSDSKI